MARRAEKRRAEEAAGLFEDRVATNAAALVAAAVGKRIIIGGKGIGSGCGETLRRFYLFWSAASFRRISGCAALAARDPDDGRTKFEDLQRHPVCFTFRLFGMR